MLAPVKYSTPSARLLDDARHGPRLEAACQLLVQRSGFYERGAAVCCSPLLRYLMPLQAMIACHRLLLRAAAPKGHNTPSNALALGVRRHQQGVGSHCIDDIGVHEVLFFSMQGHREKKRLKVFRCV